MSVIHVAGRGPSSEIDGEVVYAQLETWRDGQVTHIRYFSIRDDALAAADD